MAETADFKLKRGIAKEILIAYGATFTGQVVRFNVREHDEDEPFLGRARHKRIG